MARPASASDAQSRFSATTVRMRASIAATLMSTSLVIDGPLECLDVDEVFDAAVEIFNAKTLIDQDAEDEDELLIG